MFDFFSRFVDSNDRELKRIQPFVDEANDLEERDQGPLRRRRSGSASRRFATSSARPSFPRSRRTTSSTTPTSSAGASSAKARRQARQLAAIQAALDDILPEVFAMAREAMVRTLGMRHFDVQLIGGVVLHQGKIAEMRTGEGKTLVAPLAAILNAIAGKGVHIVTVNDYLARRDPQWMGPIFHFLGPDRRDDPRPAVRRRRRVVRLRARLPDERRAARSTCGRSRAARRTRPTSPTARTTSSGSTTSATTWSPSSTSGSSASASSGSSTRSTTSSSTRPGRR